MILLHFTFFWLQVVDSLSLRCADVYGNDLPQSSVDCGIAELGRMYRRVIESLELTMVVHSLM